MATAPITYCGYTPIYAESKRLDLNTDPTGTNAAGTYTAAITVPAKSVIVDVIVSQVALWNAGTSATLKVGDAADDDGFYTGINMKATDLLAGQSLSFSHPGEAADAGEYVDGTANHITSRYSASERTITFSLTTVGTAPTTGETICTVVYAHESASAGGIRQGTYAAT